MYLLHLYKILDIIIRVHTAQLVPAMLAVAYVIGYDRLPAAAPTTSMALAGV